MTKLFELAFGGMMNFLFAFFKGDWLANLFHHIIKTYEITKYFVYLAGILILLGLGVLSVGTFIYLISNAVDYPIESVRLLYNITGTIAKDEAAWGAFVVLAAVITFIHRERANEIQQANLRLQKSKWHYEKERDKKND